VFSFLNNKREKGSHLFKPNATIYTCTIENKVSQADYFLNDAEAVQQMLENLQISSQERREAARRRVKSTNNM